MTPETKRFIAALTYRCKAYFVGTVHFQKKSRS